MADALPEVSEVMKELVKVMASLEECRRLDIDEHGTLVRVIASPTRRDAGQLESKRGWTLLSLNSDSITAATPLRAVLDKLDLTVTNAPHPPEPPPG